MSGIYRGPNSSVAAEVYNTDGDKGDIVVSNSGELWTIDANTIDSSKVSSIDATKLNVTPSGNLSSTTVQDALIELQLDVDTRIIGTGLSDHISDTVNAHLATAIGVAPVGNLSATDVGSALNELQLDIDGRLSATGPSILTGNSTSPTLTITQTGTGNAFVVEDSASTDSTPFVIDASGNVIIGTDQARITYGSSVTPTLQLNSTSAIYQGISRWAANSAGGGLSFAKSRGATVGTRGVVLNNDSIANIFFDGDDGTNFIPCASINASIEGTPSTGSMPARLTLSTTASGSSTPTERMRIDSNGQVGIGGAATASVSFDVSKIIGVGATTAYGIWSRGVTQPTVTVGSYNYISTTATASNGAVGYTVGGLGGFRSRQGTLHADSTVTNQYGFWADSTLIGATNNYGFYGNIASGTDRWNFYAAGTAPNYFVGNTTLNSALVQTPTRSTVATGSTITLTTSTNHLLYDQAATIAALTITLPSASLTDGQVISIATRSAITALTVNGGTIYGAPTTLASGGFATFIYSSAGAAWFRKG